MSIRPTNDTTYLTGNEGQKICGVFSEMLRSRVRVLPVVRLLLVGHFTLRKTHMRIIFDHAVEAAILFDSFCFTFGEKTL